MEVLLVVWVFLALVGYLIDGIRGALLSGLLGIIGIIVALILASQDKRHKETIAAIKSEK